MPVRRVIAVVPVLLVALACGGSPPAEPPAAAGGLAGVPTFAPDPSWPERPADWDWGQVIGIFADQRGHVWTSSRNRITEWGADGRLVQSWDARGPDGNWRTIHGLFVDHNGDVWTNARESHLTVKFSRTGEVKLVIGRYDETGGSNDTTLMGRPADIWVDAADNEVFVADGYGNRRVIVFDGATGRYLRHWGAYGRPPVDPPAGDDGGAGESEAAEPPAEPPQQLFIPHGLAGSRDGLIYVADRGNNRIQVFRQDGTFVRERILRPHCGVEERAAWAPQRPCGREAAFSVAFSHDPEQTYVYVADGGTHVITVLRRSDLEVVDEFAGPGVGPGQLGRPHNITVDPSGHVYVAEAAGPEVTHPESGATVQAGFRAQKFRLTGVK